MTTYCGERTIDGNLVMADDRPLSPVPLPGKAKAVSFEWGYEGAGSAGLALALLVDHLGGRASAETHYHAFMKDVVANFSNEWLITDRDIDLALRLDPDFDRNASI